MTRILLADDSPHAQRMGERILREEGFEVVTVTDGMTALIRMADVDPDVVFADVSLPRKSGYDICRELKTNPRHKHVRVILTAGLLESFDETRAIAVKCDAVLKKPFEASAVMETLQPLVDAATKDREELGPTLALMNSDVVPVKVVTDYSELAPLPASSEIDVERVRAAVTLALDAAMPAMIERVTEQVLVALGH
ncbi:MAG TPA: response regulator [Bryobacteraceae bacterium]|nr:response regulator [Bryobacteraceae bacterium]